MRIFVFILLITAMFASLGIDFAMAQDQEIYCDTVGLLEGSVGTIIGTLVALSGFLIFLKGSMAGLVLVICGVAVGVFPQIFTSFLGGMELAFSGTKADTSGDGTFSGVDCTSSS